MIQVHNLMQIQISIPKSPIQIIQYETNMIIILQANNYTISQICMFNKHDYENKRILTTANLYRLLSRNSHWGNWCEKQNKIQAKLGETMANWNAKQLTFTPRLKQVVRFLEDDEQMTMIRDENGNDSVSVSICSQSVCQNNPRQNWALGYF